MGKIGYDKKTLNKIHRSEQEILDEIARVCDKNGLRYLLIGGTLLGAIRHNGFIPWDDDLDISMPREDYEKFLRIAPKELGDRFLLEDISTNDEYCYMFSKVKLKNTIMREKTMSESYDGGQGIWVDIFPLDYTNHFKDSFIKLKWRRIVFLKRICMRKSKRTKRVERKRIDNFLFLYKHRSVKSIMKKLNKIVESENNKNCMYYINYGSQYGVLRQTHLIDEILPLSKVKFEGKEYFAPRNCDYVLTNIYGPNYMQLPPKEKRITHGPEYIKFEDGEEVFFNE